MDAADLVGPVDPGSDDTIVKIKAGGCPQSKLDCSDWGMCGLSADLVIPLHAFHDTSWPGMLSRLAGTVILPRCYLRRGESCFPGC